MKTLGLVPWHRDLCFLEASCCWWGKKGFFQGRQEDLHLVLLNLHFLHPPTHTFPFLSPSLWGLFILAAWIIWGNAWTERTFIVLVQRLLKHGRGAFPGFLVAPSKWSCVKRRTCSRDRRQLSCEWSQGTGVLLSPTNLICWAFTWKEVLAVAVQQASEIVERGAGESMEGWVWLYKSLQNLDMALLFSVQPGDDSVLNLKCLTFSPNPVFLFFLK